MNKRILPAYLGVILIWSTTPLAIQWSGAGEDFVFPLLARMVIGLTASVMIMTALRLKLPYHRAALHAYAAAGLGIFGAMQLVYWGARYIPSGLVAVLFGLIPLFTGMIGLLFDNADRLRLAGFAGIILGLAGLGVIFGAGMHIGTQAVPGFLAVLAAVMVQAGSLVWVKHVGAGIPVLALTTGALILVVTLSLPLWWLLFGHIPAINRQASLSILYLGIFGSVAGFTLYFYVTKHLQAGQVALITLITPVSALLLGQWLNHEQVNIDIWLGTALILLGLGIHQWQQLIPVSRVK
jgi:drug/metabolite transporter (DMT)-like permease